MLRRIWFRLFGWRGRAAEREIREEIELHVEELADEYLNAGMEPEAARRAAERRFGNRERIVRQGVAERLRTPLDRLRGLGMGAEMVTDLRQDVRFAIRMMAKQPGFTFLAVLSLALGIGFNTTAFSLVDALMLAPSGAAGRDELVRVVGLGDEVGDAFMSYPDLRDVRASVDRLTDVAGFTTVMASSNHDGEVALLFGESITPNLFDVLGIPLRLGRSFTEQENEEGRYVALISEGLWRSRYGADPGVLGRDLILAGDPYTVVGVVPERYNGGTPPIEMGFWVPMTMDTALSGESFGTGRIDRRGAHSLGVVGRLAPDTSREQAAAEVEAISAALAERYPETNADFEFSLMAYDELRIDPQLDRMMMPAAGVLMGLVALILLIACANVANMLLARASTRVQEVAVRRALGASGPRLVRQLLTESILLALCGGTLGALLAALSIRALLLLEPPFGFPVSFDVGVNLRVLVFTGLAATLTGVLFGVLPAWRGARLDVAAAMKSGERRSGDRGGGWLRSSLVVVQVAVSLVLLVSAALLMRSLLNARGIDTGIAQDDIVALSVSPGLQGYAPEDARRLSLQALERIRGLPGVDGAAFTERVPIDGMTVTDRRVWPEGRELSEGEEPPRIDAAVVTPGYFALLEIPIVAGRGFEDSDRDDGARVAIVNPELAQRFWPGESPLGRRVSVGGAMGGAYEIVGVNAPHKVRTLGEEPRPHLYLPYAQDTGSGLGALLARTRTAPGPVLEGMRRVVRELDPNLAVFQADTMAQHLSRGLYPIRMAAWALVLLGGVGALLAAAGVYGVVGFAVARRTREIGIRVAVGADRAGVVRLVVSQGMRLALVGLGLGVGASLLVTRVLGALLYGVSSTDVVAFTAASVLLALVALIANLAPARRAARVHPVTALRTE